MLRGRHIVGLTGALILGAVALLVDPEITPFLFFWLVGWAYAEGNRKDG